MAQKISVTTTAQKMTSLLTAAQLNGLVQGRSSDYFVLFIQNQGTVPIYFANGEVPVVGESPKIAAGGDATLPVYELSKLYFVADGATNTNITYAGF